MHRLSLALASALLSFASLAQAAILRPFSEITSATVRLGDLFDQLGNTPDRVLGKGPGAGERISVGAAQLAAIARDFNVDWRPATGSESVVIERKSKYLSQAVIADAIRQSLVSQGIPEQSEISMPAAQPFVVPADNDAKPEISQCNYDPANGHFTALVSVATFDSQPVEQRLSGVVSPLAVAVVATHRLVRGTTVLEADIRVTRVRLALLRGAEPASFQQILGMTAKQEIEQGHPLTALDIIRPELVAKGSTVRMQLLAGGIALAAAGIAKEGGGRGDRIRVENPASHAIVRAVITGDGEVRVDPIHNSFDLAETP